MIKGKTKTHKWILALTSIVAIGIIALSTLMLPGVKVKTSAGSLSIGVGLATADVTAAATANITYPESFKTNYERLQAIYSLLEQMRLEYNHVGDSVSKDSKDYSKWLTYQKVYQAKESLLLAEQIKLKSQIIKDSGVSVKTLNRYNCREILEPYIGDRQALKVLPTDAKSAELDALKAIDFDSLTDSKLVDPLEDFTSGWAETDPNSKLTVTTNQVAFSTIARGSGCYVYQDFGAGHFTTFEHKYSLLVSAQTVSNDSEFDAYDLYDNAVEKAIILYYQNSGTDETDCLLIGVDPDFTYDYIANLTVGTRYYYVLKRDASAITLKIYTGSDYTTGLVDTLSITKGDSTALQKAYVMKATDGSGGSSTGAFNDLDLQEAAAEPSLANTPSSENLGTLWMERSYYAKGSAPNNPVQSGDCTFTITNDGDITCNITASMTDMTGGTSWNLVSTSPSANEFRMTIYYVGQNPASGLVLTNSAQAFYNGLAASGTLSWDFKFETGTWTDTTGKTGTLTLTAVEP